MSVHLNTIVRICHAENNRKPQKGVKVHLENIWQQLRTIAALQKRLRYENGLPHSVDSKGTSPNGAEDSLSEESTGYKSLKELQQTLNRDIHRFCYSKTKHRVEKYLSGIPAFCNYYKDNRLMLDVGDVLTMGIYCLDQIYQIAMDNKEPLDSAGIPYLDWDGLVWWFNLLILEYTNNMTKLIARARYIMAEWSSLPGVKNNRTLNQFDLARALQKLVTLSSHIQDLTNLAYSPRLRSILEKELEVVLVDPIMVPAPEPSLDDMKRAVQHAFALTEYAKDLRAHGEAGEAALQAALDRQLDLVEGALGSPAPFTGVHAECTLLMHQHRESQAQPPNAAFMPPLQYIAANKRSCFCCWGTYKAYAKATSRIFLLRGDAHSKLCSPWWAATGRFGDDGVAVAVRRGLYSGLVQLYSEYLERGYPYNCLIASNGSGRDGRMAANDTDRGNAVGGLMMWLVRQ